MKALAPLVTMLVLSSALNSQNAAAPQAPPPASAPVCASSPDDAAIYSAALREIFKNENDKSQIVLYSQTSTGSPPGMAASTSFAPADRKKLLDATDAAAKSDFDSKARLHCDLDRNIEPAGRIVFVTPRQEENLFSKTSGWKQFTAKYPNSTAFTLISGIGFNSAHDQALVYVGYSCGELCGEGYFVLLVKEDGKWIVQKTANIWVS